MALRKKGKYSYGDDQADIRQELEDYSRTNAYAATRFADSDCSCAGRVFQVLLDDDVGVAVRVCVGCGERHNIGDSGDYLEEATLDECGCPCGSQSFEVTVGVSLYNGSDDVRWLYVGLRCVTCGLIACYGDWKNEYIGFAELLSRV